MKKMRFPVILMILTGLVLAAVISCPNEKGPTITTYTGTTSDKKKVEIRVEDDKYDLKVDGTSISTGKVSKSGDALTLTPNGAPDTTVTVTVISGNLITEIKGSITPDNGSAPVEIEMLPPIVAETGTWDWSLSDDSKTNEYLDVQTIFSPGGASRFDNAVTDPSDIGDDGLQVKRPTIHPAGTVKDDEGKVIDQPVFSFKGTTKVTSENRAANEGARFPLLGWEAVPDEATLAKLKTAYGYSFWVRLNSSTSNKWAFLTAVFTDFPPELGYEYGHWFGNSSGDSGTKNITKDLALGKWHKIEVILKSVKDGGNIDQAAWIHAYNPEYEGPFTQNKAEKLQWQVPLQHNGGTARSGAPYDITKGSYTFDLDFYGLELLTTQ